ncbi:MAG: hypothetical protein ACYSTS_12710 [Planctomycetota bacterium]
MSGNAWEWTQSTYKSNDDNFHVIHDSSWNFRPWFLLAINQDYFSQDAKFLDYGFRLVCSVRRQDGFKMKR